jgi:GTP-binding protein HflX
MNYSKNNKPHFLIIKVIDPHDHRDEQLNSFWEEESLIRTLGGEVVLKIVQHRLKPHGATYIGLGKVDEIKKLIEKHSLNYIILNDIVSPAQIFRLEKLLWEANLNITVWDRIDLILAVFDKHAFSSEAKLQIELAKLRHLGPRIYGLGGTLLSRQRGGIGGRGIGETNIEIMRRHIKNRLRTIEDKIAKIMAQKKEKLLARRNKGVKTIALVGYTNAGKTRLFNLLTGKDKQVADAAFTTLDSYLGKIKQLNGQSVLVADTIGFVKNLPPSLIEAFKSTLMESIYADTVFHIIDISDSSFREKLSAVETILTDLGMEEEKVVRVFNKLDLVNKEKKLEIKKEFLGNNYHFVSAATGEGIPELLQISV